MLLYDFGSTQQLISAVLAEARRRQADLLAEYLDATATTPADRLQSIWGWISAPERAPFLRLFFET